MGAIYKGAALTIIAAAGDSPHSGLPGVNGTPRRQHYSHAVGTSSQKIGGLEDPCKEIENSVWDTRGWTYQELVLSRRRLVFTRSQMYFQCKAMHCVESLPSHGKASDYGSIPDNNNLHSQLRAFRFMDTESTAQSLYFQIRDYFPRRLSFPEDIIQAVTGIINAFELRQSTDRVGATHVFGLPILYIQTAPSTCLPAGKDYDTTVFTPTSTFAYSLIWTMYKVTGKRNNTTINSLFPSWSWADGKASQEPSDASSLDWVSMFAEFSCEKDLQFWVHDKSKGSLELNHYIKTCGQVDGRSLLPMIYIRSWVVSYIADLSDRDYRHRISGYQRLQAVRLDYPDTPPSDDLVAIYLGRLPSKYRSNNAGRTGLVLLIVEKVDDSTWRRIGIWECVDDEFSQAEDDTLTCLNLIQPGGSWEMRTLCLV